jgi:glutamyl-tRNA reductase
MNIYNVSISHKTAPVKIRELLAFTYEEKVAFIQDAIKLNHILECVLITTCNRSEIYVSGDDKAVDEIISFLVKRKNLNHKSMMKYFLIYQQEKAVEHLYKVASGMDSMLIGEDEILGQVKDAYELALEHHTTGFYLNTLFRDAITCAKRVKTDTNLSKTSISLGTLAAHEVFDFIKKEGKKKVLIIGLTGKMGTILMKNLYHNKDIEILGTIRVHKSQHEFEVSYPRVIMVDYHQRYEYMEEADIIVSATTSPHYTITKDGLEENLVTQKERLFLDLAVPMDIDKEIQTINQVKLHDIDYFTELSKKNNELKLKEVERAKLIIEEEVDEYLKGIAFKEFMPYIREIKEKIQEDGLDKIFYQLKKNVKREDLEIIIKSFMELL